MKHLFLSFLFISNFLIGQTISIPTAEQNAAVFVGSDGKIKSKEMSIATFRASSVTAKCVYITDVGKTGIFFRDITDISTADNTGLCIINSKGVRYKRIHDGIMLPEWWGAKADGVTDCAPAINAAILAGKNVFLGPGFYALGSRVLINKNESKLIGSGKFTTCIMPLSSFDRATFEALVQVGSSVFRPANVTISDIRIAASFGADGHNLSGLLIDAEYNIDVSNCWFQGGNHTTSRIVAGVRLEKTKHQRFTDCNFTNSYSYAVAITGLVLDDLTFTNCQFDESQSDIVVTTTGYAANMLILGCSFGHSYVNATYPTPIANTQIHNATSGGIDRLTITNTVFANSNTSDTNTAIDLTGPGLVEISSCKFSEFKRYAIINRTSGVLNIHDNFFRNNARARSDNDKEDGTNNPDTSPYQTDIFSGSGFYGIVIKNNISSQTDVMGWIENNISDVQYLKAKIEGNNVGVFAHKRVFGVRQYGTAAPTDVTQNYVVGDEVYNTTLTELGSTPNKYIIERWKCRVSGYPGTWVEMRTFTGN